MPKVFPKLSNYFKLDNNLKSCAWKHTENCFVRIVDAICPDLEPNVPQRNSTLSTLRKLMEIEMKPTTKIFLFIVGIENEFSSAYKRSMKNFFLVREGISDYQMSGYFLLFQWHYSPVGIFNFISDSCRNLILMKSTCDQLGELDDVEWIFMTNEKNNTFNLECEIETNLCSERGKSSEKHALLQLFSLLKCDPILNNTTFSEDLIIL